MSPSYQEKLYQLHRNLTLLAVLARIEECLEASTVSGVFSPSPALLHAEHVLKTSRNLLAQLASTPAPLPRA
jgi:hypothetical protein